MDYCLLDGEKIEVIKLVKIAKQQGYFEEDGIYLTSLAARYLRNCGHSIDICPPEEKKLEEKGVQS